MSTCETCASTCCRRPWPICVTAAEAPTFGAAVIPSDRHGWAFVGELAKSADGACIFLGPEGCSVYDRRPGVCRDFVADSCGMYHPDALKQLGLVRLRSQLNDFVYSSSVDE